MTTRTGPAPSSPSDVSRPLSHLLLPLLVAALAVALAVAVAVALAVVPGGVLPGAGGTDGEDGRVGDAWVGVDDDEHPAVSGLDPALLRAVRAAAAEAAEDGIELRVTSGWRSAAYQQHLLDQAVTTYGSYDEARRWVSTPELSAHVTGDAVDIGPTDAAYWLAEHGADHGLCQVYANEVWHYELLTAPGGACPEMLADGTGTRAVPAG